MFYPLEEPMNQPYPIRAALTDRSLYRDTLRLGIPIALQSLIAVAMNVADTVMLGKLGDAQVSAASMAGQYITLFLACVMGLGMGVTVLTNRFWGMGDKESLHRSVTIMLRWELLLALLFAVIGTAFPRFVMGVFTKDPETIACGVVYLRCLLPSYVCIALSQGCTLVLRSAGNLLVPLVSGMGALAVNNLYYDLINVDVVRVPYTTTHRNSSFFLQTRKNYHSSYHWSSNANPCRDWDVVDVKYIWSDSCTRTT